MAGNRRRGGRLPRRRSLRRFVDLREQLGRYGILGLEPDDFSQLLHACIVMALCYVVVGQNEPRRSRLRALLDVSLQGPKLARVCADVWIETDESLPIPTGTDRQKGVERRGRLIEPARRKQDQRPEL